MCVFQDGKCDMVINESTTNMVLDTSIIKQASSMRIQEFDADQVDELSLHAERQPRLKLIDKHLEIEPT